jgi:hypothetical protein
MREIFKYSLRLILPAVLIAGCAATPAPRTDKMPPNTALQTQMTPIAQTKPYSYGEAGLSLPDRAAFLQKDKRWGGDRLGKSGDTMASDGCLVTASAMALANLGFQTDPGDLNKRLTAADSFTDRGWLIWSGISAVTAGKAKARFYSQVNEGIIDGCLRDGYYPLARFILPNGRTHWAVILKRDSRGYYMRDPLHPSKSPLLFPRSADAFKAVRCIGLSDKA